MLLYMYPGRTKSGVCVCSNDRLTTMVFWIGINMSLAPVGKFWIDVKTCCDNFF